MKNNHEITLKQYAAYCEEQPLYLGTAGSYGMEILSIVREGVWAEYDVLATFHPPAGDAVQVRVGADNQIDVPVEATAEKGMGEIVFAGYKEGVRQIAVDVLYKVAPSSGANGTEPAEPTPAVMQQIMSAANAAEKLAQSVRDDADAGKFMGAKGDKGDTGPRGEKGDKGDNGERGPQGPKGDTGPQGERGEQGVQGEKGDPGEDGVQINDDAVNTADTWSSKHIVDTLCPPLEVSGNPAQCYPVAGYPLGCKVSWEPTQEGSGDPSPENIRPIKGRGSVTVERCGSNLLNPADYETETKTVNGITFTRMPTGGIKLAGTATGTAIYTLIKSFAYTFSISSDLDYAVVGKNVISVHGLTSGITLTRPSDNARMYIRVAYGATVNTTVYPQMEKGSKPTAYTPYQGTTRALTLPHTIYGGTVDAVTGEGQETWKLLTLDGTGTWTAESTNVSEKNGYVLRVKDIQTPTLPYLNGQIVCNKYVTRSANDTYTNNTGISVETGNNKYFRIYDEAYADKSVSAWKSYLAAQYAAGTPVQIAYKLAKPEPFTAAGGQAILALAGVNTLLTDADTLTVTGRADPIKRMTELESMIKTTN